MQPAPTSTLFPYTTLFRSKGRDTEDRCSSGGLRARAARSPHRRHHERSEEHTSELQSRRELVCRLLLEKKKELFMARRRIDLDLTSEIVRAQNRQTITYSN